MKKGGGVEVAGRTEISMIKWLLSLQLSDITFSGDDGRTAQRIVKWCEKRGRSSACDQSWNIRAEVEMVNRRVSIVNLIICFGQC